MSESRWDNIDRVDPTPNRLTIEERDALRQLIRFIPLIASIEARGQGGRLSERSDDTFVLHDAVDPLIDNFFSESTRLLGQVDYTDFSVNVWLQQPDCLERVQFPQLRVVLTWMTRGQKFCTGFWGAELANGNLMRLLDRMKVLAVRTGESRV